MFKTFRKELFKGSDSDEVSKSERKRKRKKKSKLRSALSKEQFLYQMDDGTQVSKYLLDPAYLRELYLYELATTIALMRENMSLTHTSDFTVCNGAADTTATTYNALD